MRRVVNLWLALLGAYWLMRAGASSLLFGRVDHGYPALFDLLAIPALQAVALAWATRQPGSVPLALPWREAWRLRALRGALAVDVSILAASWLMPAASRPSWLAPSFRAGLPAWLAAVKLAAAAALLAAALGRHGFRARDRFAVAALAAALLALAAEPWLGWLAGLGVFNDLFGLMLGRPLREEARLVGKEDPGLAKYFRYTLDHKVVGIQYLYGMIGYFLTGGLFAMAIRSELLSPSYHLIGPEQYLMVVGEHGTMMMMMMSSVIPSRKYSSSLLPLRFSKYRTATDFSFAGAATRTATDACFRASPARVAESRSRFNRFKSVRISTAV